MSEPAAKRRRVRKGTHSCWECRKRKVKCRFNDPTDSVCINCTERETTCISQKFADVNPSLASPASSSSEVPGDRSGHRPGPGPGDPIPRNPLCSTEDLLDFSAATNAHSIAAAANGNDSHEHPLSPEETPSVSSPGVINQPFILAYHKHAQHQMRQTSRHLHSLLPTPYLRGILAHESPRASWVLNFAQSRQAQVEGTVEPTWSLASPTWPSPETHPVLIARRLLQYAVCMQHMPPNFDVSRLQLPADSQPCDLLAKLIAAVCSLVATDDAMVACAEGIETVALLTAFQADAGHLRRAWVTNRRALSFCQLMGANGPSLSGRHLVRSCAGPNDPTARPSMPVLWRWINCMDRYLSLILGLPVGSHDDSFASPSLAGCPLEQLEQDHAVICRKIADRNSLPLGSADAQSLTFSISKDLELASAIMDAAWWETPSYSPGAGRDMASATFSGPASRLQTARNVTSLQVQHFTLLTLLHLPYLVRKKEEGDDHHAESRYACRRASRATLERFLAFRTNNVMNISGRPIDYSALIAGMTLPLTHLEVDDAEGIASDRELLENTVLIFREMASFKRDRLALESADTISQLLPIMSDAPRRRVEGPLELHIPFLGKVVIKHKTPDQGTSSSSWSEASPSGGAEEPGGEFAFDPQLFLSLDSDPFGMQSAGLQLGEDVGQPCLMTPSPDLNPENWTFQGVDAVYWSTLGQAVSGYPGEQG